MQAINLLFVTSLSLAFTATFAKSSISIQQSSIEEIYLGTKPEPARKGYVNSTSLLQKADMAAINTVTTREL